MKPRSAAAVAAGLAVALAAGSCTRQAPTHRNVMLVVVDTLRADHLPTYGYDRATAPFIDRLAQQGIVLDGYASASWTRPSIATILSGLEPQRHQVIARSDSVPEDSPWLPSVLRDEDFATVGFAGNPNAGRRWGFARGFEAWSQHNTGTKAEGARVTARFVELLDGVASPYFGYVLYVDPHDPYQPAEPWREDGVPPWQPIQPQVLAREAIPLEPAVLELLKRQYDGEIREVDRAIEQLFGELEARGLLAETLVVITADHGEEFGDHGHLGHGKTLFEESVRVPLVLWSEALRDAGRRAARQPFPLVDLAPTLLAALGLPPREGLDGVSRWQHVGRGLAYSVPDVIAHLDLEPNAALSIRREGWKLIESPDPSLAGLFDLSADAAELQPSDDDSRSSVLRTALAELHNELSARRLGRLASGELDEETRAQLAALGYLDASTTEADLRHRTIPDQIDPTKPLAESRGEPNPEPPP